MHNSKIILMRLGHDFQALNYKNFIVLWLEACFYNKNKTKIIFANHKSKFWSFNLKTSTLLEVWLIFTGVLVSKSKF